MSTTSRRSVKKAAEDAAEPELVVTNPMMANLINILIAVFSIVTIGMYAYTVHTFFNLDLPRWEVFAWCAVRAPLFIVPAIVVPMLRKDIIAIYAMGPPPPDGSGKVLAFEDV